MWKRTDWSIPPWGVNPLDHIDASNLQTVNGLPAAISRRGLGFVLAIDGKEVFVTDTLSFLAGAMNANEIGRVF